MCSLQAAYINRKISRKSIIVKSKKWKTILKKAKLHAHKKHNFKNYLMQNNKVNYIRINIFPDGGISRIRIFGKTE
jgi:allantoicase